MTIFDRIARAVVIAILVAAMVCGISQLLLGNVLPSQVIAALLGSLVGQAILSVYQRGRHASR